MDKVLYVKLSDNRALEYQVETSVVRTASGLKVIKKNIRPEGLEHIRKIKENEDILRSVYKDEALICKSELTDLGIEFEYIDGISFEDKLREASDKEDIDAVLSIIDTYRHLVSLMDQSEYTNIDLTLPNIIEQNGRYIIIDYEWLTKDPTPSEFVFWRGLFTSMAYAMLGKDIKDKVYARYGLTKEKDELYLIKEKEFQDYVSGSLLTLRDYASEHEFQLTTIDDLKAEIIEWQYKLNLREAELQKTKDEVKEGIKQREALEEQLGLARHELGVIKSSRSWKILKFLRIVKG
ncbi:MAG: hypothetical protein J6O00_03460 [Clostridiales bacterium]|nr:hypothetical protein [Clostridiales bacterium]